MHKTYIFGVCLIVRVLKFRETPSDFSPITELDQFRLNGPLGIEKNAWVLKFQAITDRQADRQTDRQTDLIFIFVNSYTLLCVCMHERMYFMTCRCESTNSGGGLFFQLVRLVAVGGSRERGGVERRRPLLLARGVLFSPGPQPLRGDPLNALRHQNATYIRAAEV